MQYDPNENVGTSGSRFGGTGSESGAGSSGSTGSTGGADLSGSDSFGASSATSGTSTGLAESGYGRTQSTGGKAREKASQLKTSLADKLEHGAQRIRDRVTHHQSAQTGSVGTSGELGQGTNTAKIDRTLDRASESLAHGMESTANWVRNADIDKMKGDVERQVRANPGRALLVAVGVGYLLGKVLRGGRPRM
ncbi:MAG TPA: hypothetical protein VJ672_16965 [Gemmatimonadaceae bacterium]|nr:hypothetical protein [Gemmatimonadaceae bacterium]